MSINLDCETAQQLQARLKAGGLRGGQRKYAKLRLKALDLRLRGEIAKALLVEREMELVYHSMPISLRW